MNPKYNFAFVVTLFTWFGNDSLSDIVELLGTCKTCSDTDSRM